MKRKQEVYDEMADRARRAIDIIHDGDTGYVLMMFNGSDIDAQGYEVCDMSQVHTIVLENMSNRFGSPKVMVSLLKGLIQQMEERIEKGDTPHDVRRRNPNMTEEELMNEMRDLGLKFSFDDDDD